MTKTRMKHVMMKIGQIVYDRARPGAKGAAIVVGGPTEPGKLRIRRWRGYQRHWCAPVAIPAKQLAPIVDWTLIPLTEAKRVSSAAFERNYLMQAMVSADGSVVDAARLAGVDRSNFRRLLQRHDLVKAAARPKRRRARRARTVRTSRAIRRSK